MEWVTSIKRDMLLFKGAGWSRDDIDRLRQFSTYNKELGFVELGRSDKTITLLGWVALSDELSGELLPEIIRPEIVPDNYDVHLHGKGVGLRAYADPSAAVGYGPLVEEVGAYEFTLPLDQIVDMRRPGDLAPWGMGRFVLRQFGLMQEAKRKGTQSVVERVQNEELGGAGLKALLWNEPPRAALRRRLRGEGSIVSSSFLVVQDPEVTLHAMGGRYTTPHGRGFTSTRRGRLQDWLDQRLPG